MEIRDVLKKFVDYRKILHKGRGIQWSLPPEWYPPEPDVLVIEVVGSKWKTSVAYMLSVNLSFHRRVGMFISPHLTRVNERIQIWEKGASSMISDTELYNLLREIHRKAEEENRPLSYFEALFLSAMAYFSHKRVEVIVLEAGLGGRLDATNSVRNDIVLITKLELEHTNILGKSLEAILREKAGVVKTETKAVFVKQDMPREIYLRYVPEEKLYLVPADSPSALVEFVLDSLGFPMVVRTMQVPGRMERVRQGQVELLLDVAHTPDSVSWVLEKVKGKGWWLVVSLAKDKDWKGIAREFSFHAKKFTGIVVVGINEERFFSAIDLFRRLSQNWDGPIYGMVLDRFREEICRFSRQVVLGSHRLVGEVRRWFMD